MEFTKPIWQNERPTSATGSKREHILFNETLKKRVLDSLNYDYIPYIPEPIAGRAKVEQAEKVSHEHIYQFVWKDNGNVLQTLENQRKMNRKWSHLKDKRVLMTNMIDIGKDLKSLIKKKELAMLKWIWSSEKTTWEITGHQRHGTAMLFTGKIDSKETVAVEFKALELLNDWTPLL